MLLNKNKKESLSDNKRNVKNYIGNTNLHNENHVTTDENTNSINTIPLNQMKSIRSKKQVRKEKFRTLLFLSILFFCSLTTMILKANALHNQKLQEGIAQEIIRFHVIANSDSNEDQELKLIVKDTLVQKLSPLLSNSASKEDARAILSKSLEQIKALAENTIRNHGYYYNVTVTLEKCYLPLKIYGDYTFPPGYYDALRVKIGRAEGKNWWCVMFPPLCFVDETYSIVDDKSGSKLKNIMTEEEYDTLLSKKTPIKIKFKLWDMIKDLFD